jgi:hypothetical protein
MPSNTSLNPPSTFSSIAAGFAKPFIICLIDGNRFAFSHTRLNMGRTGGAGLARQLEEDIRAAVGLGEGEAFLEVTVISDRAKLRETLPRQGACTGPQFDGFCDAFAEWSEKFSFFDVPGEREAERHFVGEILYNS